MVLSAPPLEELVRGVAENTTHALSKWQGQLWGAAQLLRAETEPEVDTGWMGTLAQLSSEISGSVLLGGDGGDPAVVPLSTDSTPTVKGSLADPLVRLVGAPGHSGRYVALSVVIGSTVGIWPAVVTVGDGGGKEARGLRDVDDRAVELQVVKRGDSRIAFRLVDSSSRAVLEVAESAEELAHHVKHGQKPVAWAEFLERCLWGLPKREPTPADAVTLVLNKSNMRELASLWGLEPLRQERVPLLSILAFLATAAELPDARALANEIAMSWDKLTAGPKPRIDGKQLMHAVEQLVMVMLPIAGGPATLSAVQPARALDAVAAAIFLGESLLNSLTASAARTVTSAQYTGLDSPRASRSKVHTPAGMSTYITVATATITPAASPTHGRSQRKESAGAADSDSEDNLTRRSLRREVKRLRQLTASTAGVEDQAGRKATKRGAATRAAPIGLPEDLTDLSDEVRPAANTGSATPTSNTSDAARPAAGARTGPHELPAAGQTMGTCIQMTHTAEVKRLIPASADSAPLKDFGDLLEMGGMPDAPSTFAQAATTATTGIVPGKGTELEAEMLAVNIAAVLDDLVLAKALPDEHPAFHGGVRPVDWVQAAARGRALILATARAFRQARPTSLTGGAASGSTESTSTPSKPDKVPEDAYAKVSEATTNSLKILAASAGVINSLTTDKALRGERLRGSPFETLTGYSRDELDAALPGELDYFVDMYGQAATAYLVSNSRSLEEVSGRGVPAALVGIRRHLWSRALRWVQEAYGERRATQRRVDVEKLALSLLAGAVPAEPVGTEGEKLIIELLGGSKPHKGAEIEREGGSLSTGTIGKLVGEAAQFSVRVAYRKWAKGLARCMGEVLLAANGRPAGGAAVLGTEADFGVEDALLNVSEDLPAESLRSIGRFLLEEIHAVCAKHRSEPAAPLPDVIAIVAEMGGDVFKHRRQEHQLETLAQAAAAKLTQSLTERLKAVEAKHQSSGAVSVKPESYKKPMRNQAAGSQPQSGDKRKDETGPTTLNKQPGDKQARAAGVDMDDSALASTAKKAAKKLESSMQGDANATLDTRFKAVAALQAEYRKSVGSPVFRRLDEKEPCAWLALVGKCKEASKCKPCSGGLSFDAAMVQAIRARCAPGLFGAEGKQPAVKEPG